MKRKVFWGICAACLIIHLLLTAVAAGALAFTPEFEPGIEGCRWTNAVVPYVACPGVTFGSIIAFLLNLPFLAVYSVIFGAYYLFEGKLLHDPWQVLKLLLWGAVYLGTAGLAVLISIKWIVGKIGKRMAGS